MSVKPRKRILASNDHRMIVHAGLLVICAMLSVLGVGALAFLCFLPAAGLVEVLSALSPSSNVRRM